MTTNAYIDGGNLYYGAVKGPSYKWLDLSALCGRLLRGRAINRVRYFTALAAGLPNDPDVRTRQRIYLRALETIPALAIHLGEFKTRQIV